MENNEQLPAWYLSTQGPEISGTVRYLAMLVLPVIYDLSGISIGVQTVDRIVQAGLIVIFAALALKSHLRAKKTLGARIQRLKKDNLELGARLAGTLK
jgi:hypothetical protein